MAKGKLRLTDFISELTLPKRKWIPLNGKDLQDHADEIWDMIQITYRSIGGHPTYRGLSDITSAGPVKFWRVVDVDEDPKADAVLSGKPRGPNVKISGVATDGGKDAKRSAVKRMKKLLKTRGYYAELSGRPAEIMFAMGIQPITDEDLINKLVTKKGREPVVMTKNGYYKRKMSDGKVREKILVGIPK